MRFLVVIAALVAVATAVSVSKQAPLYESKEYIEGEYIVVFQKNIPEDSAQRHHVLLTNMMTAYTNNKVKRQFHIGSFRGYSAKLDDKLVEKVRMMPEVQYIERNGVVKAAECLSYNTPTWGLARVVKRGFYQPGDDYYYDNSPNGEGVDVYVIDTGIDISHPDFGGRARFGFDSINDGTPEGTDPNGHGTHVASTATGDLYGIAKKATAIGVRVLNSFGSGTYEQVIAGVDWVAGQHQPGKKSVINMSLGGAGNSLHDAVNAAAEKGVHVVAAAGNENTDACSRTPAGADGITSVGASDINDQRASFSNYGNCVEIWAPGVNIIAAVPGGGSASYSGTSMASPHVAGTVADVLSQCDHLNNPVVMEEYLKEIATKDAINGVPPSIHGNDFLFKECELCFLRKSKV